MYCRYCGKSNESHVRFCIHCGQPQVVEFKMKWFKWLIYFSLWVGLVTTVMEAINMFTGNIYWTEGVSPELVYSTFGDGLKKLDAVYAFILLALASLYIITRFKLAAFEESGPKFLYATSVISTVCTIIYNIVALNIIEENALFQSTASSAYGQLVGNCVGCGLYVWLNYLYFSRRKALFVN